MEKPDFKKIGLNDRGCRPIFHVRIKARWRSKQASKKFDPDNTQEIVYKGLPTLSELNKCKTLKVCFFRDHFGKGKSYTDLQYDSFTISDFEFLAHLGYENDPGI